MRTKSIATTNFNTVYYQQRRILCVLDMIQKCKLDNCSMTRVITDNESGELVCGNCGSVLEEKLDNYNEVQAHSLEEFMSQTRTGPKSSLVMYDKGMYSVIGNDRDSTGKSLSASNKARFRRLRLWDNRSKTKHSSQRTLSKSLIYLNGLKEKLGIPQITVEVAASLYRKAMSHGLTRGRNSNSLMAATLYVSCRQTMTPRSLQDIAKVGNTTKKALQKTVRILIHELGLDVPQYNMSSFITKISNNLGINEKIKRHALNILDQAQVKQITGGKHPIGQAAASLYLAVMLNGVHVSQTQISKISGVTGVTLRTRMKTIQKALGLKLLKD